MFPRIATWLHCSVGASPSAPKIDVLALLANYAPNLP